MRIHVSIHVYPHPWPVGMESPRADTHADTHSIRTVVHMTEARIVAMPPRCALEQPGTVHTTRPGSGAVSALRGAIDDAESASPQDGASAVARGATGGAKLAAPRNAA